MSNIHGPKYVKRAKAWNVTVIEKMAKKDSHKQTQNWFNSELEAEEFIKKYAQTNN